MSDTATRPTISLGSTDPRSKKAREENARFYRIGENLHKSRPTRKIPMPDWMLDEARSDAKRQKAKGWKPLVTAYKEWPAARAEYLAGFE